MTDTERAACIFVAALAQNADANRGTITTNGTPATRAKVADLVVQRFFTEDAP